MTVRKRTNGYSWPLDKAQILSWLVIVYFATATFASLCLSLATPWSQILYVLGALCMCAHICLNLVVMWVNPGEEAALKRKIVPQNDFDRSKHKHVIENQFCNICQIVVSFKTKHCKRCNKCITHFDHHCIYLNNCIGSRNYKLFIFTIVSAFIGSFIVFFLGLLEFSLSFDDSQTFLTKRYYDPSCSNQTTCPDNLKAFPIFTPVRLNSWRAYTFINSALAFIVSLLIGYLISYHIFLGFNKMTTYEHTVRLKLKADEKRKALGGDNITSSSTRPNITTSISSRINNNNNNNNNNFETTAVSKNSLDNAQQQQKNGDATVLARANNATVKLSNGVNKLPVINEPSQSISEKENMSNVTDKKRSSSLSSSTKKSSPSSTNQNDRLNVARATRHNQQFSNKAYEEFIVYDDDDNDTNININNNNNDDDAKYFQLNHHVNAHTYYNHNYSTGSAKKQQHQQQHSSVESPPLEVVPPATTDLTCVSGISGSQAVYMINGPTRTAMTNGGGGDDSILSNRSDKSSEIGLVVNNNNHNHNRFLPPLDWNRRGRKGDDPRLDHGDDLDDDDVIVGNINRNKPLKNAFRT